MNLFYNDCLGVTQFKENVVLGRARPNTTSSHQLRKSYVCHSFYRKIRSKDIKRYLLSQVRWPGKMNKEAV
jgi:hypothetical protein